MLVLQHNCHQIYAVTIAALEAGLELQMGLACLQESYINDKFQHREYQIYWPEAEKHRNQRVAIVIQWDLFNKIMVEAWTDLLDHSYLMTLDVWELGQAQKKTCRTWVINCYNNWLDAGQSWQRESERQRRAIEKVCWDDVLEERCLLLGDFNAHSPLWNPLAESQTNAGLLEGLIERKDLFINNEPEVPTRPKAISEISVIDLILTTACMRLLKTWRMDQDCSTGSDHEMLVMKWGELEQFLMPSSREVTGWQIQALQANPQALEAAKHTWQIQAQERSWLGDSCLAEDLAREATWIQKSLTIILNQHTKPVQVSPRSKHWWNQEIKDAHTAYNHAR